MVNPPLFQPSATRKTACHSGTNHFAGLPAPTPPRQFARWLIGCGLAARLMGGVDAHGAGTGNIQQDAEHKLVTISDGQGQLSLRLNYDGRCVLDQVVVRGRQVAARSGVSSGILVGGHWYNTQAGITTPQVSVSRRGLTVSPIVYGPPGGTVRESWRFTVEADRIRWRIERTYSSPTTLEDTAFPEWDFSNRATWTGGLLDNGGVVWNKYLETPNATYGAHAGTVTFWNREQHDGLRIAAQLPPRESAAMRFSHQPNDGFSFHFLASDTELAPKHDLCRFLPDRQDLWAPFPAGANAVTADFVLQAVDYDRAYDRGHFPGLNGDSVRELLNTVARYGVIDRGLVGGNGWRSGYVCLHEQWFGEIAQALAQPDYINNYATALNYARDHAQGPDGRIKSRWAYNAGDAMPGTYDARGFYEAQWGYLLDSQPDYVINVAELFDLTADRPWLAGQKHACEQALDYLLRREVQHSGLVSMMTESCQALRGSDWVDII